ncbi:MAG: hypothetical protein DBY31_00130 [Succinivibrio sp.]|nr:MAG: hypothetical protein DBY31_00130 [Succinivibrio sp.]
MELSLLAHKSSKYGFDIIAVSRHVKDFKVDLKELQKQFDKISKQVEKETESQPVLALLMNTLLGFFRIIFGLLEEQIKLNQILQEKLGNKTVDSKRANNENINGRGCEKKKGVDSSDKNRIKATTKEQAATKDVKVVEQEKVIGYDGKEYDKEEADKLIGTTFIGADGRRYKYTRKLNSSRKTDFNVTLTKTQYFKLEYVPVDDDLNPLPDAVPQTAVSAKTDFLKKTEVSVNLMAHIVYLWIRLKSPLNRVATSLAEYGIRLSRQQLYKNVGITADMLMPIFKRMKYYIQEEVRLLLDETYYACREKLRLCISPPEDDKEKSKAKGQRSLSKSMRSYFYGIVGDRICLYYHDLDRNSDIPKDILISNNVREDAFVETDGFYRKSFNISTNEDDNTQTELFKHGVCYVHLKRYFCVLINYATKTDGTTIAEFVECKWEQDIEDSKRISDKISKAFLVCNKITKRCDDKSLDIVALKHEELRPLIDAIFTDIRTIYDDINCKKGEKARRSCSKKFRDAIKYAINNETKLKTFLDSPYGLMSSTKVEEKFRELDILRNGMLASDTCKGAENLALFYSLYKTAQMHGIEFETYLQKAITVMTEHLDEIEFEKDHRGTIIGYKSHSISDEILDKLMPWNMAQK